MPYAMRIYENGGPEKLRWEEVQVGAPGEGQVRVRSTAIGRASCRERVCSTV